jgi:DNA-binding XRE family transcriptional regulator
MKLKDYISEKAITQVDFGKRVGVSKTHINKLIKKERTPSLRLMKRIISVTGGKVSPEDFETEKDLSDEFSKE